MPVDDLRRALVIGAGSMGPGIAQLYAIAGCQVDLVDVEDEALARADHRIRSSLETLADLGALATESPESTRRRIRLTTDLAAAAPLADVATEAIVEDASAKSRLLATLDGLLRPGVLLASNTSGLDVFAIARQAAPARLPDLVIHHYFLPPTLIPLVEVVAGPETTPGAVERSVRLLEALGKLPVALQKFTPNFIVNSFQVAIGTVAARLLAEGVATPEMIDTAVKASLGVRLPVVGVVQTLDFTGLDLIARILRHSGVDATTFEALVAEGRTGVKSGRGLYDYGGRTLAQVEAARDRKYWEVLRTLRAIDAFKPL